MDLLILKNKDAFNFIQSNNITLSFTNKRNTREVTLVSITGEELGSFSIQGRINIDPLNMNINVEEISLLRGKGLARLMIAFMLIHMEFIRKDQLIYIDTDASAGFWRYIGMQENRYYSRGLENIIGRGYEMHITFSELAKWALGVSLGN